MKWNPGTPLTSPAIRAESLEEDFMNLWHEFLEGYFDGQGHDVNGASSDFPLIEIIIQQGKKPTQPLNGNLIAGTWTVGQKPLGYGWTRETKVFEVPFNITFWMRSSGSNTGTGGPHVMVRRLDSLLFGLLNNRKNTLPLARKGIRALRCQSPVLVTTSPEPMRSVVVTGTILYSVTDGGNEITTQDGELILFNDSPWEI
jgi:hypothetical protein